MRAADSLSRLRGQPTDSDFIQDELAEIVVNNEYERSLMPEGGYWSTWKICGRGKLRDGASNLRRTVLGTSLQMVSQWTGVNFVFYFGTTLVCLHASSQIPVTPTVLVRVVRVYNTNFLQ